MITTKHDTTTNAEIQKNDLNALKESLGVTGMLRFPRQFDHGGTGDYTAEKYIKEEIEPSDEEIRKIFGF